MESYSHVFVSDQKDVFRVCEVLEERGTDDLFVKPHFDTTAPFVVKKATTFPIPSINELQDPPTDLIKLVQVHPASILFTLRSRFARDNIYTSIGPILVTINPFKWIPGLYDQHLMEKYKCKEFNLSDNPHVFAVAAEAFEDMCAGQNQSLIIR